MADEDDLLFMDFFEDCWGPNCRVVLPRNNPFEEYDDRKFKKRFRLSKSTVLHLLCEVTTRYFHFTAAKHKNKHQAEMAVDRFPVAGIGSKQPVI